MTVEQQMPDAGACLPDEDSGRHLGPKTSPDSAGPASRPPPVSQEELVALRHTVARLRALYPSLDAVTVETAVRTAYDSFQQARVRAYVPVLVERRSRRVLGAACRDAPGRAVGHGAAPETRLADPGPEKD